MVCNASQPTTAAAANSDFSAKAPIVSYVCDDLVLRVPQSEEVARLAEAEHERLTSLPHDLPLAGVPLADADVPVDRLLLAASLGRFLRRLHSIPPYEVAPEPDRATWAAAARRRLPSIEDLLGSELARAAIAALSRNLPPEGPAVVMSHRDLTDDHILIDTSTGLASGIIDFGDAGQAPWWQDFVGIWMWEGDEALTALCATYGRHLDHNERLLMEHHAIVVAVWDIIHATQHNDSQHPELDEVSNLRKVLRNELRS